MLAAIIIFAAAIRIRLLEIPLERDEGEFAYMGQLMLEGVPPYAMAYNMKLPGIYAAYALIMALFGQTIAGIHLGLLLVNAGSIILVFLLGKRLLDPLAGVMAAASYAILSVSPSVLGTSAHATHFVVLPALAGILLMLKAIDSGRPGTLFWSGLLLGLAFIMKQPGIIFIVFAGLYFLWSQLRTRPVDWSGLLKKEAIFSLGAVIPFGVTCFLLYRAGVFDRFWFWTFKYAREYGTQQSLSQGVHWFLLRAEGIAYLGAFIWALAGIGLIAPIWDRKVRAVGVFLISFLVFSFLAVCPGLYFRQHYFVLMLPAGVLLTGAAISSARHLVLARNSSLALQVLPVLLCLTAFGQSVLAQRTFFFQITPTQACRIMYGPDPFPESLEIARYIEANSATSDRIAVLGSEPQIFFYSHRRSATGYIYTYGLMEKQAYALRMHKEMIREIEAARPEYVVFVLVSSSWAAKKNSETLVLRWAQQYCRKYFDTVGVADIVWPKYTAYYWGRDAAEYVPRSPNDYTIFIFRRKVSSSVESPQ